MKKPNLNDQIEEKVNKFEEIYMPKDDLGYVGGGGAWTDSQVCEMVSEQMVMFKKALIKQAEETYEAVRLGRVKSLGYDYYNQSISRYEEKWKKYSENITK